MSAPIPPSELESTTAPAPEAPTSAPPPATNGTAIAKPPIEDWVKHFTALGHQVIASSWPGFDPHTPAEIRANPKALEGLHIGTIVDHYAAIIKDLSTPPIIIGHSFGGLFVQILLSRGLGLAGVGVCPAQPNGIRALKLSTVKASIGVLGNPLNYNKAVPFTEKEFHYAFGNHLSEAGSKLLWEKYAIPAAGHILFQGVIGTVVQGDGAVDWGKKDRAPLLLIAGTNDHVVPKAVVEVEKEAYYGPAIVGFKAFEGRTHGIVNQAGWEEVADFALKWVEEKVKG